MRRRPQRLPTGRPSASHIVDAPALLVAGLSATYDERIALTGIDFRLETGEQLAIVGPNGAGKSTLLKVLAGMLSPVGGRVEIHGHGPCHHMCIAYVPQKQEIDWRFPVTVHDVVMMGRIGRLGLLRRPHTEDRRVVREALASVDLEDLAPRQIAELSGGQQQRMFLARALAQEAEVVLLDEPFAGLDVHSRQDVLGRVGRLRGDQITVVVALHDLGIASSSFDRVLLLNRQQIGFGLPSDVFSEANLRTAYGSCLRVVEGAEGTLLVQDTACAGDHDVPH